MSGHIAHQGGLPQRTQEEEANGTMSARYTREIIDSHVVLRIASLTNEPRTLTAEAIFGCPIYNVIIHRRPSEAIFGSPTEDPCSYNRCTWHCSRMCVAVFAALSTASHWLV